MPVPPRVTIATRSVRSVENVIPRASSGRWLPAVHPWARSAWAARREVERTLHPNWAGRSRIATGRSGVLVFAARRQANHRRKVYAGQRLSFRTAGQARSLINGVQSPGQNRTPGNPTVRDRRAALRTVTSTADGLLVRALNFEPDNRTHSSTGGDWKRNATASPRQPPTQPCSATTWWITRNVRVSRSSPGK